MDLSVPVSVYVPLSVVMFLEYAVWGAWAPVLAARLLGPLKMSGKQTGWIYATLPLACIVSPLVAGQMADQWFSAKWILAGAHLLGAVLLLLAAYQRTFGRLFVVMLLYSMCYAATMPLANSVLFDQVKDISTQGKVFIWAPVAWALVGYLLTGWRWIFKTEGEGRDCLVLAAVLSVVMGLSCFALTGSEPARSGEVPIVKTFAMLQEPNFLIFLVISMVVAGMMQFYFLGSAQFMMDQRIPGKNVSGAMALAQVAQAVATWYALGLFLDPKVLGFKWTLVLGIGCWLVMYLIYVGTKSRALIVAAQPLHGLAYVFFIIAGQIFADAVAPSGISSSVQALMFAATTGLGLFVGTQLAGIVMDRFKAGDRFQWRPIWMVPCAVVAVGLVTLAAMLKEPEAKPAPEPAQAASVEAAK